MSKNQIEYLIRIGPSDRYRHLHIKGEVIKTPLFNQDFNDSLTFSESDLKTNWESYKRNFTEEGNE